MCLSQRADTAKHSKRTFQLFWKEAKKKIRSPYPNTRNRLPLCLYHFQLMALQTG